MAPFVGGFVFSEDSAGTLARILEQIPKSRRMIPDQGAGAPAGGSLVGGLEEIGLPPALTVVQHEPPNFLQRFFVLGVLIYLHFRILSEML